MRNLKVDNKDWDIHLDASGDIITVAGVAQTVQAVANAIQLFTNDAYFDADRGIPHFVVDLGIKPAMSVVRSRYRKAALAVDGVTDVDVKVEQVGREIQKEIVISFEDGQIARILA